MLWSIPVLIYFILFSPELARLLLGGIRVREKSEKENANNELAFEYLLPMVAAASAALMYSLLAGVSWPVCLMLMCSTAALVGGVAFTLVQMHILGLPYQRYSSERAVQHDRVDANESLEMRLTMQQEMLVTRSNCEYRPYPHHEDFPESAGEDQGQLTSHLSGSTPFVEDLYIPMRRIIRWAVRADRAERCAPPA
jgi:hypothetical protein